MSTRLKMAVIGDPHIAVPQGDDDPYLEADPGRKLHGLSVELIRETISQVNAEGVDAVLIMGDLTRDSEPFNHEVARGLFAELDAPYYMVLGNHDLRRKRPEGKYYPDTERFDRGDVLSFYEDKGFPGGTRHYAVELPGDVLLVVLDSNLSLADLAREKWEIERQEDGFIDEPQFQWMADILKRGREGGAMPIVALHHAILPHSPAEVEGHMLHFAFRHWMLTKPELLHDTLEHYEVPLVLSGHLHAQSANRTNGVLNLVTSAAVSYPHAWRLLTVTSDAIRVESRRIEGVPSCPNLAVQSKQWLAEGMGELVRHKAAKLPLVKGMAGEMAGFIARSEWWPRFCDGTQAGFAVEEDIFPRGGKLTRILMKQLRKLLNEYGQWKDSRPDPNNLEIMLTGANRRGTQAG